MATGDVAEPGAGQAIGRGECLGAVVGGQQRAVAALPQGDQRGGELQRRAGVERPVLAGFGDGIEASLPGADALLEFAERHDARRGFGRCAPGTPADAAPWLAGAPGRRE